MSNRSLTPSPPRLGSGADHELIITCTFGTLLSVVYIVGVSGNVHTLVVMRRSLRLATSMHISIMNLALADLLYLSSIPFVVSTYFLQDWYFGDAGCRVLLSLDLLTMHASIFTLTVMCAERYVAVTRPLRAARRSKRCRAALAWGAWLLSLALAVPMTVMVAQTTTRLPGGRVKRMCAPTCAPRAYKAYVTVLFCTSIMAPGIIIGCLYVRLARAYLRSQRSSVVRRDSRSSPKQKVLVMIFSIVLVFWACFLPFWIWQLLPLYHTTPLRLAKRTRTCINYLVASLTYTNSCINPFLYTLLTRNYREYLKTRHRSACRYTSTFKQRPRPHSWAKPASSSTHFDFTSDTLVMGALR